MSGKSLYLIPFQDKFLIYRPLRRLLFLGNRAMAELAEKFCESGDRAVLSDEPEVLNFFDSIGFTQPDPPEPPDPDLSKFQPTGAALLMSNRCNLRCIWSDRPGRRSCCSRMLRSDGWIRGHLIQREQMGRPHLTGHRNINAPDGQHRT